MVAALLLAGVLFIVQTWVASLLVPDAATSWSPRVTPRARPSTTRQRVAGGQWLSKLTALATAIAWGFANSLVAQAATSRLLYAMARDRQLPAFLRPRCTSARASRCNATLLVAVVSLVLGLYFSTRDDGIRCLARW